MYFVGIILIILCHHKITKQLIFCVLSGIIPIINVCMLNLIKNVTKKY